MRSTLLPLCTLLLSSMAAAQVVASDDFSYTGALTSNGWVAHSGAGNKVIMSNGSHATLDQSSGSGEDDSLVFPPFGATDRVFASFRFRVPSGSPVNPDGQGLYFAHFKDSATSFRGRTGLLSPASAGDFVLAINADSSDLGVGAAWPSDLSFDTWYAVVISWDASTGTSELWLDPTCGSGSSITHTGGFTGDAIEAFALRQSNDYTGLIDVDDIVVGGSFADVLPGTGSFSSSCAGCAGATQAVSGSPNIGGNVYYSVPNATGILFGFVSVCSQICPAGCSVGSDSSILINGPDVMLAVPCDPALIGGSLFSQGVVLGNGGCSASIFMVDVALSDTIQTTFGS